MTHLFEETATRLIVKVSVNEVDSLLGRIPFNGTGDRACSSS